MKIYHYMKIDDWDKVNGDHEIGSGYHTGLRPRKRLGKDYFPAWEIGGVYGLLEPTPGSWVNNKHFGLTWEALKHDLDDRMLVEIEVDPEHESDVFVVDRAYIEGALYDDVPDANIPEKYTFLNRTDAERACLESKVSLSEYLQRR